MKSSRNALFPWGWLAVLILAFPAGLRGAESITIQPPGGFISPRNPLVWDAMTKRVKFESMGQLATFTFWVTNTAPTNVSILSTQTSCDCTVAQLPTLPWVFKPGDVGSLTARVNITGKHGLVTNAVGIMTSEGPQLLGVVAEIPLTPAPFNVPAREREQQVAQTDRQAVFKSSCAACHVLATTGNMMGEALFAAACSICHDSDRRADFVPDLSALTRPTSADYWRAWTTYGRKGSMMPAFAEAQGGILNAAQIESLVRYLVTRYPSKGTPGALASPLASFPIDPPPSAR